MADQTRTEAEKSNQGARRFAKWMRRLGYVTVALFLLWTFAYSYYAGTLWAEGDETTAREILSLGRSVQTWLLRIAFVTLATGLLVPIGLWVGKRQS